MFKNHVREPAKRDLAMVAKGDNTRVKCSYSRSECKLDKDVHRISNGFFNYVGKSYPSLCVKEHYANIHLDVILHNLRNDFGIHPNEEMVTRFKEELFKLDGSEALEKFERGSEENKERNLL